MFWMHILIGFDLLIILVLVLAHENVKSSIVAVETVGCEPSKFDFLLWCRFELSLVPVYRTRRREKDAASPVQIRALKRHFVTLLDFTSKLLVDY